MLPDSVTACITELARFAQEKEWKNGMIEIKAIIQNAAGIHCRPTAEIVKAVLQYDGTVTVVAKSGSCEVGSALELLMLGLEQGTEITLQIVGPDEVAAAAQFKKLFETNFDFPDAQVVC